MTNELMNQACPSVTGGNSLVTARTTKIYE